MNWGHTYFKVKNQSQRALVIPTDLRCPSTEGIYCNASRPSIFEPEVTRAIVPAYNYYRGITYQSQG